MSHFLTIDVEASGQEVTNHRLLAIGACVVSTRTVTVCEPREQHTFRVVFDLPPTSDEQAWDAATLAEFWRNPAKGRDGATPLDLLMMLARCHGTCAPEVGIPRFLNWLHAMGERYAKDIVIVTDTACFDAGWLQYYVSKYGRGRPQPEGVWENIRAVGAYIMGWLFPHQQQQQQEEHAYKGICSLNYVFGRYQPVRDSTSFHMGVARRTPRAGLWGAERSALEVLGIKAFPSSVTSVPHDHDPANDAERIGLEAALIANALDTIRT